jgi:hypothetical protein
VREDAVQYASAMLRALFREPGPIVPLGEQKVVSSQMLGLEAFRAIDWERLLGNLNHLETSRKAQGAFGPADDDRSPAVGDEVMDGAHGEAVEFWTHDGRQRNAAPSAGLKVLGLDIGE